MSGPFFKKVLTRNAALIRINIREPFVPPKHIGIPLGALETLQKIDSHIRKQF